MISHRWALPCKHFFSELCLSFSFSKEFDRILLHGLAVAVGCAQLHTFCRLNNKDKINDFIFLVEAQSDWTTSREHKISPSAPFVSPGHVIITIIITLGPDQIEIIFGQPQFDSEEQHWGGVGCAVESLCLPLELSLVQACK